MPRDAKFGPGDFMLSDGNSGKIGHDDSSKVQASAQCFLLLEC